MKRKTSEIPTRVYTYGAHQLSDNDRKVVHEQLFRARRYYNRRVEIECKRRDGYRELRRSLSKTLDRLDASYADLDAKCESLAVEISKLERKHRADSPLQAQLKEAKQKRKAVYENLKAEQARVTKQHYAAADKEQERREKKEIAAYCKREGKAVAGPHIKKAITSAVHDLMMIDRRWDKAWKTKSQLDRVAYEDALHARQESGCYPGTYMAVDAALTQAFKTSVFNPKFKSFNHTGIVGVQLTDNRGLSVSDAFAGTSEKCSLAETRDRFAGQPGHDHRTDRWCVAKLKLYDKNKDVVSIQVPFKMHRDLPRDAIIKKVNLKVGRIGLRTIYELQFVIEAASFLPAQPKGNGLLAVRYGWRVLPEGSIQVATTWDGKQDGQIVVPLKTWTKDEQATHLLEVCDRIFDGVRDDLHEWFDANKTEARAVSKALKSDSLKLSTIPKWRGHGKLVRVARVVATVSGIDKRLTELWGKWRRSRLDQRLDLFPTRDVPPNKLVPCRAEIMAWAKQQGVRNPFQQLAVYLHFWSKKDAHLTNWARSSKANVRNFIRNLYREFAAKAYDTYEAVVVGAWNKSQTAKRPAPERDKTTPHDDKSSQIRHFCGVSILDGALKNRFGSHRIEVPIGDIPDTHFKCGGEADSAGDDTRDDLTCSECGRLFSRTTNGSAQLWSLHGERFGGKPPPGPARKKTTSRKRDSSRRSSGASQSASPEI